MRRFIFIGISLVILLTSSSMVHRSLPGEPEVGDCKKIEAIREIISEAIAVGAPTYNEGNHIGCYRIYEGAAYKIIYRHGSKCKEVKSLLEDALEMSYGNYNASEKAWIMRIVFDKILGVPTVTR